MLQRLRIKPRFNPVKCVSAIDREIKIKSRRTVYDWKKELRQHQSVKRRLENEVNEDPDNQSHDARRY
jgi:hypothetical protein